jgi:hypothetical protein
MRPGSPVGHRCPRPPNEIATGGVHDPRHRARPFHLRKRREEPFQNSLGVCRAIPQEQIQNESQGSDAPFNQVILRAPGVAQDSYGQLHVLDEHANLQYRIDDVLIPEGITGFGQEIDTH